MVLVQINFQCNHYAFPKICTSATPKYQYQHRWNQCEVLKHVYMARFLYVKGTFPAEIHHQLLEEYTAVSCHGTSRTVVESDQQSGQWSLSSYQLTWVSGQKNSASYSHRNFMEFSSMLTLIPWLVLELIFVEVWWHLKSSVYFLFALCMLFTVSVLMHKHTHTHEYI